jgi:hypothetical protein|tara:strand:+ start:886 stop:1026 length:141 start_codon:yes stop_codon:yes gene_type:complete
MANDSALAAVASQPSISIAKQAAPHMNNDDINQIKQEIDASEAMHA